MANLSMAELDWALAEQTNKPFPRLTFIKRLDEFRTLQVSMSQTLPQVPAIIRCQISVTNKPEAWVSWSILLIEEVRALIKEFRNIEGVSPDCKVAKEDFKTSITLVENTYYFPQEALKP